MFETSTIQVGALAPRGRASLLTISLIAHSAAIIGTIRPTIRPSQGFLGPSSIASVRFPIAAPDEYRDAPVFMPVQIPPPLGNPNGGAKPALTPVQKPEPKPAVVPTQPTAPTIVPDTVEPAATPGPATEETGPSTATGTVPGPVGVAWGTKDSIGDLDAPPAPIATPAPENKVYTVGGDVKAPVLIQRVDPPYPASMQRVGVPATVVVRCVIDKNGSVRDAKVIVGAMPPFNQAVLAAVQQWRYNPGSLNGIAVDTYLEVTVHFSVRR